MYLLQTPKIFEKGIKEDIANAILIKFNQIGTITETLNTIYLWQKRIIIII